MARDVRLERMRPAEIAAAKAACPAAYVPFGALEWHGLHNPVGLDGLKAQAQLVRLAERVGGVVFPPVYFGAGGEHGSYDHSYIYDAAPVRALTEQLLARLERDGYRHAILLSGHYPNYWEYLKPAAEAYRSQGGTLRVLVLIENQVPGVAGDHATMCETSFMLHLMPETVEMSRLVGRDDDRTPVGTERNWMGEEHRDHPCYGLVGSDPRGNATAERGATATETLLAALATWLRGEEMPRTWG